jgi:transcriptional regulator with GAF, ATPase, and Fis domain
MEVSMKVVDQLCGHDWPGNVRELENVIERAVLTSVGTRLTVLSSNPGSTSESVPVPPPLTLDAVERRHIEEVLKRTKGQIAGEGGAAEVLGLHPNTLRGRMAKLGVTRPSGA